MNRHQGHSAAGRIMSVKNLNDRTGNRTFRLVQQCLNQQRHHVLTATWQRGCSNSGKDNLADRLWEPHSLVFNVHHISLPRQKQPRSDVNQSPLSTAEGMNIYSYISSLHMLSWLRLGKINISTLSGVISLEEISMFFFFPHRHH